MKSVRSRLFIVALTTLGIQTLAISLGVARVCWGAEHIHSGADAMDCPHHGPSQPASHDHHAQPADQMGRAHQDDSRVRLGCGCSNNLMAGYLGPAGVVPTPAFLSMFTHVAMLARAGTEPHTDVWIPPLSPPPRTLFS
jgi:hypothetical protein